jgi:hypothetical protein
VEVIRGYPEAGHGHLGGRTIGGRNLEFAPERIDVLLMIVHTNELHHMVSHGGVCTISTDHKVEIDLDLRSAASRWRRILRAPELKPSLSFPEVGTGKSVVEEECHIWHPLEYVQQALVQSTPIDSKDSLETVVTL